MVLVFRRYLEGPPKFGIRLNSTLSCLSLCFSVGGGQEEVISCGSLGLISYPVDLNHAIHSTYIYISCKPAAVFVLQGPDVIQVEVLLYGT